MVGLRLAVVMAIFAGLFAPLLIRHAFHLAGTPVALFIIKAFYAASFRTEVVIAAVKHHVLPQHTLKATVEKRNLY